MLRALRTWCSSASGRRRLLFGGVCAAAGTGALVVLLSWAFGAQILGTMVRAFFTAASAD